MANAHTVKTLINRVDPREMGMRDILGSMEELTNMIGIKASSYPCEILSIEPPAVFEYNSCHHRQDPYKKHAIAAKSQILPFKKK